MSIQAWSFDRGNFKVVAGIDPDSPAIGPSLFKNWVSEGNFFRAGERGVAVVERHYARSYGLKTGGSVDIAGEQFRIIGMVTVEEGSQLSAPNFFLPIDDVRRLVGIERKGVNAIYIQLEQASDTQTIIEKISNEIPNSKIASPDSSLSVADNLFSLSERFIWLISLVIMVVAVFLIFKTVSSNISERTKEIGIMKAVGWTGTNICGQIILETFLQTAAGAVLGVITGVLLSFGLSVFKINAPLPWQGSPIPGSREMTTAEAELVPLEIHISPLFLIAVFASAVLIALVCGFAASRKAVDIKPAETLRRV
jgi:putative ABC transport system permease protein